MTRLDRAAIRVATGFGVGDVPWAPGTAGSIAAVPLAWALGQLPLGAHLLAVAALIALALAAAHRAGPLLGAADPPRVVIDEVAGLCVALLFAAPTPLALALGLVGFRVADSWKPWPARWCERNLPGGWGVVLDDVAAGLWVAAGLALVS